MEPNPTISQTISRLGLITCKKWGESVRYLYRKRRTVIHVLDEGEGCVTKKMFTPFLGA